MSMANKKNPLRRAGLLLGSVLLLLAPGRGLDAETRLFSFTTSKGLAVKVLQDNDLPFIHAQLLIYLDGSVQNYSSLAIAQLTVMNMFERTLNSPPSNLMDMLERQGNDFQVEQNPEYVKISMNFLPDRLGSFSKLLKEIFTYQSFHLNKFNRSKQNFWPLFMKGRDWKKEIALLLAYQQLIGNFYFVAGLPAPGYPQRHQHGPAAVVPVKNVPPGQCPADPQGQDQSLLHPGHDRKGPAATRSAPGESQEGRSLAQLRPARSLS